MNPITSIMLMISAACLTLGLIHLRYWLNERHRWELLAITIACFSVAWATWYELQMHSAATPAEYGEPQKWIHVPIFFMFVSLALFIRLNLRAGRTWLFWLVVGSRLLALLLNFIVPQNLNFREITGIKQIYILGSPASVAEGVRNPLMLVGQIGVLLFIIFCIDAVITIWRRGDRRKALTVGSGIVIFAMGASIVNILAIWGLFVWPVMHSPFYLGMLIALGYELSYDMMRVTRLATDLAKSEAERLESIKTLAAIVESSDDAIISETLDGIVMTWNAGAERIFGYSAGEIIGKHISTLAPDDRKGEVTKVLARIGQGERVDHLETERVAKDGRRIHVLTTISPIKDENGAIIGASAIARDMSEYKAAQAKVRDSEARLAGVVGSAMDAIISIDEKGNVVLFNSAAEKMFGRTAAEAMGQPMDGFLPDRFRTLHQGLIRSFGESSVLKRFMGAESSLFGLTATGDEFPLEASISQVSLDGQKIYTVILRDITERLQVEEALRQSEKRFREMADTAPVLIWMSGPDRLCTYVNKSWLDFTGRSIDQELGHGWTEGVHRDDYSSCLSTFVNAFERREPFTMQYRLRRADAVYRWVYDTGTPRLSSDGEFLGYIGSCIDVTDQKDAEDTLRDLSGRLINAQERERSRVARELHDDLSQSLALLSIQLSELSNGSNRSDLVKKRVAEFTTQIQELSLDVHRISYELHPVKLEQLGLESALRGFCREVASAHGFKVSFDAVNIPRSIPNDVSLCLYRIAQESLQNVVRHSNASRVDIYIEVNSAQICLVVTDNGCGFDPDAQKSYESLGLVSMVERIRSVNGTFTVDSTIGSGTEIIARIPFAAS